MSCSGFNGLNILNQGASQNAKTTNSSLQQILSWPLWLIQSFTANISTSVMHGSVAVCLWLIKRANLFYFILIYSHMSVEIFVLGR